MTLIALIGRLNQTFGVTREFDVIAAAILGGTSLFGGVEFTQPDQHFSIAIARRSGAALERPEAAHPALVDNGPIPNRVPVMSVPLEDRICLRWLPFGRSARTSDRQRS